MAWPLATKRLENDRKWAADTQVATQERLTGNLGLVDVGVVPHTEPEDALHIALATVHGCKLLVSWNFAHFVGFESRYRLLEQLKAWDLSPAYLVTPEELLFGASS